MHYCCLQFGWDGGGADELESFLWWKSGVRHVALPVIKWNIAIDLEGDLFSRPFFLYCYSKIQFLCTFSGMVLALAELQLQSYFLYQFCSVSACKTHLSKSLSGFLHV